MFSTGRNRERPSIPTLPVVGKGPWWDRFDRTIAPSKLRKTVFSCSTFSLDKRRNVPSAPFSLGSVEIDAALVR
jgi:hypothetical protein